MPLSQNQGDAWTVTSAYLDRFVEEQRLLAASEHPGESEEQAAYLRYMSQTGRRVAEMHLALASRDDIADFRAGADPARRRQRWIEDAVARAERVFDTLEAAARRAQGSRPALVDQLLAQRDSLARPPERAASARHRRR